jgi:hypothetical protein
MEADMLGVSSVTTSATRWAPDTRTFIERVRDFVGALGDPDTYVWARSNGPHVILGRDRGEAFARLTPLGSGQYGLAFRAVEARPEHTNAWEPLLLVDDLASVVEHALVAVDAIA